MKSQDDRSEQAAQLRRRAEEKARSMELQEIDALPPEENRQTLHELRVYQIELEMQNEDLRRAQAELDAARARYFDLFNLAPVGYCTVSEQGLILEANLTAATLLGVVRGDLIKRPLSRFILPEDQDIYYRHRNQLFETGESQACEFRMLRAGADLFWTRMEATTGQNVDGASVCHAVMSDITDRKLVEEAMRESNQYLDNLFNFANAPIIVWNPQFRITRFNHAFESLTGRKADEVVGEPLEVLFPPALVKASMERIAETLRGERWEAVEIGILHVDGSERTVLWNSATIFDSDGTTPMSTIAQGKDITKRIQAEDALRAIQRRQAEAERLAAVGRVAARVAHEINNPLAGIRNAFRLVRDAVPADHPDFDMVERIEREIDRISHIVRQMYSLYSKQEVGINQVAVARVIEDVLTMLEPLRRERGVAWDAGRVPFELTVQLVEGGLQQILYNLVANAIEASPSGGVVAVAAKLADEPDQKLVEITVRDQGQSIPPEIQHRLFEPFFTSKSGDDCGKGLGLGLSIVRSIVESHGGSISLESTPGQGTVFHVFLPHHPTAKEP